LEKGAFKVVLVMEQDPFGQSDEKTRKSFGKVKAVIALSTHQNRTTEKAAMAFPVRAFTEKQGTFVNATSRLQRFRQAVEPGNPDILESSLWLCRLAKALKVKGLNFEDNPAVFNAIPAEISLLKDLTFDSIPAAGKVLALPQLALEPFQGLKCLPNIPGDKNE